ncbi:NADPH:quinone reductase (plasmid) [Natrialba magadii ATCC 43099]|uniref:Alcohol dehydrogenase GroES domain-containing protein n=1 Tax=Natrialba magadii (strain ATCC 43099 / DSM 3394 / CCM 3739 / CIP 104546 / IAM 13178 / JCM 8861 / NBRC 102185 / NCIMB 2190 / MS3) TaxID=547559 RepID=D3T171_NATMM|nr:NADPH:quinone reductase [Natrialba magadii]ADD07330.1 NADPH:quinone reductase [Natrialba magadii ATCC 43099]ELY32586.1 alcohol dehydrogenase GroES domain-containing protein [Natrialba magadii ATCC 43099]
MKAVQYQKSGDPDVLTLVETERPDPAREEVLVEIRAASVNPVDAKIRQSGPGRLPKTTGSDLAGVVAAVGDGVSDYDVGDRVFATGLHTGRFSGGSFAEFATVPTDLLAPLPDDVSFKEGAAVALVGVTAWRALLHHAGLEPVETAFIHGGNGGVGHVAVGLADTLGSTPVTTARPSHHEMVSELGAETVLDYTRDDLTEAVREASTGADVILDHLPETYSELDVEVAAFNGDVVFIAGETTSLPNAAMARSKELDVHLMSMSNLATHAELPNIGPILDRLGRLLAADRLDVRIDRTHSLAEAAEAHRAVIEESIAGKIVVVP